MKVVVNYPELEEDKLELENRIAEFRAALLMHKIESLDINDVSKRKILNSVLEYLKENV